MVRVILQFDQGTDDIAALPRRNLHEFTLGGAGQGLGVVVFGHLLGGVEHADADHLPGQRAIATHQAQAGQDAVQLMTVHAAKGLEFDCVFITGLEEGLFPHENAMSDFEGLEEERRLMYVAITRARKRLYLSHSQTRMLHGQTRYNIKSRFFDEMPEHTLKWLTPQMGLPSQAQWGARPNNFGHSDSSRAGFFSASPPPVPQRTAPQASGPNAWVRSGVQVFHTKFGEGTVVSVEGVGEDARAQVKFNRHGVKWLALSVAKLTQV